MLVNSILLPFNIGLFCTNVLAFTLHASASVVARNAVAVPTPARADLRNWRRLIVAVLFAAFFMAAFFIEK